MGNKKEFTGIVTSNKMQKTIVVKIMHLSKHVKYGKVVKRYNKFKAHDEKGLAQIGDTVIIEETRPLSKDKRFMLKEVLKKAEVMHAAVKEEIL